MYATVSHLLVYYLEARVPQSCLEKRRLFLSVPPSTNRHLPAFSAAQLQHLPHSELTHHRFQPHTKMLHEHVQQKLNTQITESEITNMYNQNTKRLQMCIIKILLYDPVGATEDHTFLLNIFSKTKLLLWLCSWERARILD